MLLGSTTDVAISNFSLKSSSLSQYISHYDNFCPWDSLNAAVADLTSQMEEMRMLLGRGAMSGEAVGIAATARTSKRGRSPDSPLAAAHTAEVRANDPLVNTSPTKRRAPLGTGTFRGAEDLDSSLLESAGDTLI